MSISDITAKGLGLGIGIGTGIGIGQQPTVLFHAICIFCAALHSYF